MTSLSTSKNHALVEFALAGMNNALFVSQYEVELPKKDEMAAFIEGQMRELGEADNVGNREMTNDQCQSLNAQ